MGTLAKGTGGILPGAPPNPTAKKSGRKRQLPKGANVTDFYGIQLAFVLMCAKLPARCRKEISPPAQADMDHGGTFAMRELDKALQKGGTTLPQMNNKIAPKGPSLMDLLRATRELKRLASKHLYEAKRKSANSKLK